MIWEASNTPFTLPPNLERRRLGSDRQALSSHLHSTREPGVRTLCEDHLGALPTTGAGVASRRDFPDPHRIAPLKPACLYPPEALPIPTHSSAAAQSDSFAGATGRRRVWHSHSRYTIQPTPGASDVAWLLLMQTPRDQSGSSSTIAVEASGSLRPGHSAGSMPNSIQPNNPAAGAEYSTAPFRRSLWLLGRRIETNRLVSIQC